MVEKFKSAFAGNKKYVAAAFVGVIAAAQYLGYSVPSWVPMVLSAVGLA